MTEKETTAQSPVLRTVVQEKVELEKLAPALSLSLSRVVGVEHLS